MKYPSFKSSPPKAAPLIGIASTLLGLQVISPAQAQTASGSTRPMTATSIHGLRCENLERPMTVDNLTPRLSWIPTSSERGWQQTAYQIRVASSPALLKSDKPDLWDSGKVKSSNTVSIRYAGKPLTSGTTCYWQVRVWDGTDKPSSFSETKSWQMGLLNQSDWKAQWISSPLPRDTKIEGLVLPPPPYFRKTISLTKPVRKATLYASAMGVYEMHLNGRKVGNEFFAPGWTEYKVRAQYQGYDVTSQLRRGNNTLGAILGDGWYSGHLAFGQTRNRYGSHTALRAQLVVEYNDGTSGTFGTDTSWQSAAGPITYSDMLMGEEYDARKVLAGWDTPTFRGTDWQNAIPAPPQAQGFVDVTQKLRDTVTNNSLTVVSGNDLGGDPAFNVVKRLRVDYSVGGIERTQTFGENETVRLPAPGDGTGALVIRKAIYGDLQRLQRGPVLLVGTRDPKIRVTEQLNPKAITQPQPGNFIFDMGQNMVGLVQLKVRGAAGTRIRLRFAEMLNPDGTAYTANLRGARATDTYVCAGKGVETWTPTFTFHGFRYVEVTGFPGTPTTDAITGLVIGSDTPKTGNFSTSSPLVNQLQANIDWGQRGNFLSVPTDCPQRDERLGWMGDAQVFARTATYNRDVSAFFDKWLQDVLDAQSPDGGFSNVSPRAGENANGAPAWGDAGVIVPWTMYQMYGDRDYIDRNWNAMERWMTYLTEVNPDGLWKNRRSNDFGDWLSINADTPKELLGTAYYGYDAQLMAHMAKATGRTAEEAKYNALFQKIKDAFNAAYVQNDGRIKGDTQTAYLVALRFNLLPEDIRPLATSQLVADIAAKNGHLSTGFIGVGYLCPTLTDTGHNDVAYKLLLNETFPSWGYSIRQGATTIWERWDGWTEEKGFQDVGMNSFNHYSLGSVGEWMFGYVGGIMTDPERPGFERILLQPHPGPGLTHANASFDSVRGRIVSNWKVENGTVTYDMTVPANTTALVRLPGTSVAAVREGTSPLASSAGIVSSRQDGNDTVIEVGAGSYRFSAPYTGK